MRKRLLLLRPGAGQIPGGLALFGAGVLDRLGFVNHHPLPVLGFQQFAVPLQQPVAGEHQIHLLQQLFLSSAGVEGRRGP